MPPSVPDLPVLQRRSEIMSAIRDHQVVVVAGATGSGKTTQLPQFCLQLDRQRTQRTLIGHTQPRRIAARAVASRIADELNTPLGGSGFVGVKVRFADQTTSSTQIKVMTDGVLLAELASDPRLQRYSTIIIDEAHERSLNVDFLLGYLRTLLPTRPDLKLVITSATIDTQRFSDAFGGPAKAPVIEVSGRLFPVEVRYQPPNSDDDDIDLRPALVADAAEEALRSAARFVSTERDVLVFLPGEKEIRACETVLRQRRIDADILPLYARLTNQEQDRIFVMASGGRQRVILATNVAETSLTVPGIRCVVDTGVARLNRYDPQRKVTTLHIEPISVASANQRAGRCGRVADGVCIRLYSERSLRERDAFTTPEIHRTNLASVILQMRALNLGPVESFSFVEPPDKSAIQDGYETLFELGAIDQPNSQGALTGIGNAMSRFPVDPRIARMLLAAEHEGGALDEVIIIAAGLSVQDARMRPLAAASEADRAHAVFRHDSSDFLTLLKIWDQFDHAQKDLTTGPLMQWCREHFLAYARMREWGDMIQQLRSISRDLDLKGSATSATADAIHRALLTGLIAQVACREDGSAHGEYRSVRAGTMQIHPGSSLFKKNPKWIMAGEVVQTTRLYARAVAKIELPWIEELAGHVLQRQYSDPHIDPETAEPSIWERQKLAGIVVVPRRRTLLAPLDRPKARSVFIRDVLVGGRATLPAPPECVTHNASAREHASVAEAKLRRRDVLKPDDELVSWFDARLPSSVCDPSTFAAALGADLGLDTRLRLQPTDVLTDLARDAASDEYFPSSVDTPSGPCTISYAFVPGKDEDGVTFIAPLDSWPQIKLRARWLVPGMLVELVHALFKQLPKPDRMRLEAPGKPNLPSIARDCAGVMMFGVGQLSTALSEALSTLFDVAIDPGHFTTKGLPTHLQPRVKVLEATGAALATDRDLDALDKALAPRLAKRMEQRHKESIERRGLTSWSFPSFPKQLQSEEQGALVTAFPGLHDDLDSVSLTLFPTERLADLHTHRGIRRLFALANRDELQHHLHALPTWSDMVKQHAAIGSTDELTDALTCLIVERTFMSSQALITSRDSFETRQMECWGRLAQNARDLGEVVARILDARARVAHRLSGGTPRLWADSIADMREHAAYLMPRGFLRLVPVERLRQYPKYVEALRARLFSLREDGSKAEIAALAQLRPHWKRFTGWVAQAQSQALAADRDHVGEKPASASSSPALLSAKSKAPLPQARRAAPTVNIDAGAWSMEIGRLPQSVELFRWAIEDFRVQVFSPEGRGPITPAALDDLWTKVQSNG